MNLNEFIENELEEMKQARRTIEQYLKTAPRGRLKTSPRTHGKCYYFLLKENGQREYIPLKDIDKAKALATKTYYYELRKILLSQEEKLKKIARYYNDTEQYELYASYSEGRQQLLEPFFITPALRIEKWKKTPYIQNPLCSEQKTAETAGGYRVRSEAEAMIADLLGSYKGKLLYRYEQQLLIAPYEKPLYPSFEIISLRTGKVFYWEHVALTEDKGLLGSFAGRMNRYAVNGIIPGKNLVLTFECETAPLSQHTVRKMIEDLII